MKKLIHLILVAVALAMGISTLVLNITDSLTTNNAITLIAIGVSCLAIANLQDRS